MATTRFYSEAGRIIMSKPGYWASPSLPDAFKIFDSNWSVGNVLIASGSRFVGQATYVIGFPAQHFVPIVEVKMFQNSGGLDYYRGLAGTTVTTNTITVSVPANVTRIDYAVYGISQ